MNIVDYRVNKKMRDEAQDMYEVILQIEQAIYEALEKDSVEEIKAILLEIVGEDPETYFEEEGIEELNFDDESLLPWSEIQEAE